GGGGGEPPSSRVLRAAGPYQPLRDHLAAPDREAARDPGPATRDLRGDAGLGKEDPPVSKSVLCTCEDVTLDDVRHAIEKGYRDIESIKRYTGFGTGVCQGKTCLSAIARVLAERTGAPPAAVLPFTPRPPL